jgi:zinc transporter, ZIP family
MGTLYTVSSFLRCIPSHVCFEPLTSVRPLVFSVTGSATGQGGLGMDTDSDTISLTRPLLLSVVAGSATGLGGLLVFALPHPSDRAIALSLTFASGVMITVSVWDLWLPQVMSGGGLTATAWLLLGALLSFASRFVKIPEPEALFTKVFKDDSQLPGSGDVSSSPRANSAAARRVSAWRLGFLLCVVLAAHNLPEGLLVGVGAVKSRELGLTLCIAILIHNIAEGVAVAIPVLAGTGSRRYALLLTVLSGFSEPVGAVLGVLALRNWLRAAAVECAINACLCIVGGVMLGVSFFELLPQAWSFALAARNVNESSGRKVAEMLFVCAAGGGLMLITTAFL